MFTQVITLAFLSTTALGAQFYTPVHDFGAMLKRGDAIAKRQGYYPTTRTCGEGDTCAEACGPTQVECPSDFGLYCYDPTIGDHCCPDGSGNSCNAGYYCTSDGEGTTYCCPDGMETSDCAAAYSLTVSLIRETGTVSAPSGSAPTSAPASTTPIHITSILPTATATLLPTGNATYTTSSPPEFTGGAGKVAGAGMAVLAGAAGFAGFW